jgi:hypothetical protein
VAGGVLAAAFFRAPGAQRAARPEARSYCPVDGPPLQECPRRGPLAGAGRAGQAG